MNEQNKVYILILNYNGWKGTIECLESVFHNNYPNFQVIVCDNASHDGSLKYIKVWAEGRMDALPSIDNPLRHLTFPPVPKPIPYVEYDRTQAEKGGDPTYNTPLILIQAGANLGFSGGNNIGLRYALSKADFNYVWLLNNDTLIDSKALMHMIDAAENSSHIGAVGSILYYMNDPEKVQIWGGGKVNLWLGISQHHTAPVDETKLHYITGASLLLRRKVIEQIGLLNEDFFLYWEETDLCFRMRKSGWKLTVATESKVWHEESASLGRKNPLLYSYFNSSAKKFFLRHAPVPIFPIIIGISGRFIKRVVHKDWKQAQAVLFRKSVKNIFTVNLK